MPAVVEKCLGSTRAGTKGHALELALQYTEAAGSAEGVVVSILHLAIYAHPDFLLRRT